MKESKTTFKKYLYLGKFEDYVAANNKRLKRIEKKLFLIQIGLIGAVISAILMKILG